MTYDDVDRLDTASGSWGAGSFSYDSTGNLLTKHLGTQQLVYGYDPLTNRLSTVTGNYNFGYDDRGNVTSNGHRSFVFNRANQLTSSGAVSYVYDGHNRRVKKNTTTASYSVYNKSGQLLLTDGPQGITRYIYLGSQLIARIGNAAAVEDKPGYTGHLEDDDLSLTYMQQRYYDSVLGRFYSNDPVGFSADNPMSFNRYLYVNNNPYKYTDPNGEALQIVNQQQAAQVLGYINSTATCSYNVNENGFVSRDANGVGQGNSKTYSQALDKIIASDSLVTVQISEETYDGNVDKKYGGGATLNLKNGSSEVFISGNANTTLTGMSGENITVPPASILAHELADHALPNLTGQSGTGHTGVNKINSENGKQLIGPDNDHQN